ncbi:MAG TPA: hypothetical protein VHZ74_00420 [Bryobacteraceae bacterium]|jgi:imidazolonepropionase-like amidohydrolase|nr:hypothetical protein [Bryobacteraceae bacterium]
MITGSGGAKLLAADKPAMKADPRFDLYPEWLRQQATGGRGRGGRSGRGEANNGTPGGDGQMVMDAMHAGAKIVAGTDEPNAFDLHGELESYVLAGMTPYEALKSATVNTAEALIADIVIVEGNPLENIASAHHVKRVIANGMLYELDDLIKSRTKWALAQ